MQKTFIFVLISVTLKMFQTLELQTLTCNVKQLNSSKIDTISDFCHLVSHLFFFHLKLRSGDNSKHMFCMIPIACDNKYCNAMLNQRRGLCLKIRQELYTLWLDTINEAAKTYSSIKLTALLSTLLQKVSIIIRGHTLQLFHQALFLECSEFILELY